MQHDLPACWTRFLKKKRSELERKKEGEREREREREREKEKWRYLIHAAIRQVVRYLQRNLWKWHFGTLLCRGCI